VKKLEKGGFYIALYGMAIVLVWIGIFKFTPTEARGIKSLVENSPLMSWMYHLMSQSTVSSVIGSIEIVTGGLLILQPVSPKSGFLGGILSTITFTVTLSFIFTTPGAFGQVDGVWIPDQFLLKDLMAFGISIYTVSKTAERLKLPAQKKGKSWSACKSKAPH
jgi:reactive chlorine resistance protein C